MKARSLMTMRCVVLRNTAATDPWGQPGVAGWTTHLSDVPCFAVAEQGQEVAVASGGDGPAKVVVIRSTRVLMPDQTDVTEKDRLVSITDRAGAELFPGPLEIKSVDRTPRSHLELLVKAAA